MNSFRWAVVIGSFLFVFVGACVTALFADLQHPTVACMQWEKDYWNQRRGVVTFDRVSSYFWSSLCAKPHPIVLSASEGTDEPSFPDLLSTRGIQADQFTGAYRGLKTFGYISTNPIHAERLANLRALVFINPVYFSFAAHTDASNIRLNAISNLRYAWRVHSWVETWDEFLFDSLFVGFKEYCTELQKFRSPPLYPVATSKDTPQPGVDTDFDQERNLLKERAPHYTSFNSRFGKDEQPTRWLFENSLTFAKEHPEARVCFVMLPINAKNLRYFHRDTTQILAEMEDLYKEIPPTMGVDLLPLSETPKIFPDPMHLTPWGKELVVNEVLKTDCAKAVFEDPKP